MNSFYRVLLFFCATAAMTAGAASAHGADAAEEYLRRADSIRNPSAQYEMSLDIRTPDTRTTLQVFLKGTDRTLVVTKDPARDRGRNMLMLDRDFYTYIPNLKRSVRLSLSQKLSGQVANGDVSRTRWFGDYSVISAKAERSEVELLLDGKKPNLTYQKIRLWLEAKTARPIRADYLTLDGKKTLKTAKFGKYRILAGQERPSEIRIQDLSGKESVITVLAMGPAELDDGFFTEKNMERMR